MSKLHFHSPFGEAALNGSEHAHFGALCTDMVIAMLGLGSPIAVKRIAKLLSPAVGQVPPAHQYQGWRRGVETSLVVGDDPFHWRGHPIASKPLLFNTALALGNDPIRLAARLYYQCEIHAWVDGPNRAWLADIMQDGLNRSVFRDGFWFNDGPDGPRRWSDQGWTQVIELLRARDDEPVVTSYSVEDQFPNRKAARWEPVIKPDWRPDWAYGDGANEWADMTAAGQEDYRDQHVEELWSEIPTARRWELGMAGLRGNPGRLELTPDDWDGFVFGHGLSVFDLLAHDRDARLEEAFAR
ncbi:hypothetical protein BDK92_7155 [Micromonospora pisi]|uniref:Uncharacterized protein n=1 Tax=Micromonospora pisi TaxID=589240 RepID=A0A495JVR9_9ACTN|nr:hypothetical protein [Micromonospora pisi]RKR92678.1 hypothetical protein BDK92_7155 [Micromonospora pisi]